MALRKNAAILIATAFMGLSLLMWVPVSYAETGMKPGEIFKDCAECPELVIIPAGSFQMGSDNGGADEKPVHGVRIPQTLAIGKTEVTQRQWRFVMGSNPSKFTDCGEDCPVEQVSWDDVQEFIRKLDARTGKQYRLPNEAEWEYACRAGERHDYCGGDDINAVAWHRENGGDKTHPVGQKQANAWGLYDMSGNVWEWVRDCWNDSYLGAPADGSATISDGCTRRVLRGGARISDAGAARAANRGGGAPGLRTNLAGFRLARTLP